MKFKTGDTVRTLVQTKDAVLPVGTIAEIVRIDFGHDEGSLLTLSVEGEEYFYVPEEVEIVASKGRLSAEEIQEIFLRLKHWENSLSIAEEPDLYYHLRRTCEGLSALQAFTSGEDKC